MHPFQRLRLALVLVAAVMGVVVVFVLRAPAKDTNSFVSQLKRSSLSTLEFRLKALDQQLVTLAQPSMRMGVGAVGYRSIAHIDSAHQEWIQITFSEAMDIDQVVLVPTIWRDTVNGFRADGFPSNSASASGQKRRTRARWSRDMARETISCPEWLHWSSHSRRPKPLGCDLRPPRFRHADGTGCTSCNSPKFWFSVIETTSPFGNPSKCFHRTSSIAGSLGTKTTWLMDSSPI